MSIYAEKKVTLFNKNQLETLVNGNLIYNFF